jgi:pimeloyl-ACP methyl ester carboxylesterase
VYTDAEKSERIAGFAPAYVLDDDGGHLEWIWRRVQQEYPEISTDLATELVRDYLSAGPDFATGYRSVWRYEIQSDVDKLDVPTMLVAGGRDRIRYMHTRARCLIPFAEEAVLDDATDFVAEQEPERFALEIERFLGRVL